MNVGSLFAGGGMTMLVQVTAAHKINPGHITRTMVYGRGVNVWFVDGRDAIYMLADLTIIGRKLLVDGEATSACDGAPQWLSNGVQMETR